MNLYICIYSMMLIAPFLDGARNLRWLRITLLVTLGSVLVLLRGLRWQTGTDWYLYLNAFKNINIDNFGSFYYNDYTPLDVGYSALNLAAKSLGLDYTGFLIATNAFIVFSFSRFFLKYSSNFLTSFCFYFGTSILFPVRQHLALAIAIFAYGFLIKRTPIKFVLVIALAASIHSSAVVVLPFYFLFHLKVDVRYLIGVFFVTVSLAFTAKLLPVISGISGVLSSLSGLGSTITSRIDAYSNSALGSDGPRLVSLVGVSFQAFQIYIFSRCFDNEESNDRYRGFLNSYLVGMIVLWVFKWDMKEMSRIQDYFLVVYPVLLSYLIDRFPKCRFLILIGLSVIMVQRFLGNTVNYEYATEVVPYRSIYDFK